MKIKKIKMKHIFQQKKMVADKGCQLSQKLFTSTMVKYFMKIKQIKMAQLSQ